MDKSLDISIIEYSTNQLCDRCMDAFKQLLVISINNREQEYCKNCVHWLAITLIENVSDL